VQLCSLCSSTRGSVGWNADGSGVVLFSRAGPISDCFPATDSVERRERGGGRARLLQEPSLERAAAVACSPAAFVPQRTVSRPSCHEAAQLGGARSTLRNEEETTSCRISRSDPIRLPQILPRCRCRCRPSIESIDTWTPTPTVGRPSPRGPPCPPRRGDIPDPGQAQGRRKRDRREMGERGVTCRYSSQRPGR
jgi:hypothetical protein